MPGTILARMLMRPATRLATLRCGTASAQRVRWCSRQCDVLDFETAQRQLPKLSLAPDALETLQLYGLYKQSTQGRNPKPRPSVDPRELAKWDAWYKVQGLSPEEAQEQYVELVTDLVKRNGVVLDLGPSEATPAEKYPGLSVQSESDGIMRIHLARPERLNAFNRDIFTSLTALLKAAALDDRIKFVVLQGQGRYFSSGNDLTNFAHFTPENIERVTEEFRDMLFQFVQAFIDFPKPIVAGVNGPAIGIGCTLLGLCDVVYAAESATFHTPFSKLAQTPEGCSSYLFPQIMGPALGREVLFMGRTLSASEAHRAGFVSDVFPNERFTEALEERIRAFALFPCHSVILSKELVQGHIRDILTQANTRECDVLLTRWRSPEVMAAVVQFNQRKR